MKTQLITEAELAQWLNISKSTLHKLRGETKIPYQRIGTCIRYSTTEIEAWLASRSVNTTEHKEDEGSETKSDSPSAPPTQSNQS